MVKTETMTFSLSFIGDPGFWVITVIATGRSTTLYPEGAGDYLHEVLKTMILGQTSEVSLSWKSSLLGQVDCHRTRKLCDQGI